MDLYLSRAVHLRIMHEGFTTVGVRGQGPGCRKLEALYDGGLSTPVGPHDDGDGFVEQHALL